MLHRPLLSALCLFFYSFIAVSGRAGDRSMPPVEEKLILISSPIPVLAYIFRPRIEGPLPLVVMNHGESLDATERSFFPLVEFRDAAFWFARRGNLVVVPIRPGFSRTAIELPERGLFGLYFGEVGKWSAPNFRDPGIAIAVINQWVIDHMIGQNEVLPKGVVVVGQSGGGWGALALSSLKSDSIRAIITFAAGRGGHVDGKPNNNCAPDRLVAAAGQFGRTARIPVLSIYVQNDSYFGPVLSKQMLDAYRAAGGDAEYHLLPEFGNEGHFFSAFVRVPFAWCFSNTCVAARAVDATFIGRMKAGKEMTLKVVDARLSTVLTSLPLDRFASINQGPPSRRLVKAWRARQRRTSNPTGKSVNPLSSPL